ncbi:MULTISPECIES: putative metalloprotease CJM1_0395 family protein [Thalassospira]|nr:MULTISPECIES: putative metalloprotease CJM1_0395 family protein [Thalassospira]MDG4721565.1 putative metalloprotease CJM1_0395 family protein [Thalassospira sp. FZY0004]
MPAAVALVPLSNGSAPATQPAQPTRTEPSASGQGSGQASTASASAPPAPTPPPPAPPINSAASVITVIQQLDPRDIAGDQGGEAADTQSLAERQQQEREATPTNARQPTSNPALLTASEREIVQQLRSRDAAVRTEEESHQTLAGANAGMISYSYTAGPDGRLYATGGKVSIHPLQGLDGIAAIANQAAISRAASVPGSSAADFNVAKGASMNISAMISAQAYAAAESYRATIGLNAAPSAIDLRG